MNRQLTPPPRRSPAPGGSWEAEIEIKRSRFIARLAHADSEEGARAHIAQARAQFPTARHHCSAFILFGEGALNVERSSDDGEPAGTAGTPMLEVLRGAGLTDVAAVVTRYFGGVLLGTGGLVRAYSEAVRAALAVATLVDWQVRTVANLAVDFAVAGRFESELRGRGVEIMQVDYAQQAILQVAFAPAALAQVQELVSRLSAGAVELLVQGEQWRPLGS
ncbi:YigZ family protein [Buchananella hordeovulneris]|uniref:YigZ family protein n=1 Tax=Buchananella hordeovulneris TaxID=52770 RepID=A0A1Q5PXA9_9ACTO|nr:YigZ family protein [Buchananella hordeovulneris]OKL52089.1 hypothetical protein BSZ40_04065 [Buchananella hordeovulneris]RRD53401.1 YigZ family protein [Buchananella hordeovulneris]